MSIPFSEADFLKKI